MGLHSSPQVNSKIHKTRMTDTNELKTIIIEEIRVIRKHSCSVFSEVKIRSNSWIEVQGDTFEQHL